jgi:isocitrate dehydrogenase
MTKDNIMKMSDGLFREVFDEVKVEYPEIETDSYIIDIGAAKLATAPERFDVIVCENLYGDIISDIAAEMTGSVGLAGSANIGNQCAMFEAIHGSAPDIAGQGIANPSGLLLGAVMMLVHIGQNDIATKVHNAWLRTIEDGNHTVDIFRMGLSKAKLTTHQFTNEVIDNLGKEPVKLIPVKYAAGNTRKSNIQDSDLHYTHPQKDLVGIDVFFDWNKGTAQEFGDTINALSTDQLVLQMVSNRGAKVWPDGFKETFCTDHWRARFKCPDDVKSLPYSAVLDLMHRLVDAGYYVIKTENLYFFDGKPGYTRAQGQ